MPNRAGDQGRAVTCCPDFECEFDPYDDSDEESWHYRKICASCGKVWWGLHCDCDGVQNPCPYCGYRREDVPTPMELLGLCR